MPRHNTQNKNDIEFKIGELIEFTGCGDFNKPGTEKCFGVIVDVKNNGRLAEVLWPYPDDCGDFKSDVSNYEIAHKREPAVFLHYRNK